MYGDEPLPGPSPRRVVFDCPVCEETTGYTDYLMTQAGPTSAAIECVMAIMTCSCLVGQDAVVWQEAQAAATADAMDRIAEDLDHQ